MHITRHIEVLWRRFVWCIARRRQPMHDCVCAVIFAWQRQWLDISALSHLSFIVPRIVCRTSNDRISSARAPANPMIYLDVCSAVCVAAARNYLRKSQTLWSSSTLSSSLSLCSTQAYTFSKTFLKVAPFHCVLCLCYALSSHLFACVFVTRAFLPMTKTLCTVCFKRRCDNNITRLLDLKRATANTLCEWRGRGGEGKSEITSSNGEHASYPRCRDARRLIEMIHYNVVVNIFFRCPVQRQVGQALWYHFPKRWNVCETR